MIKVFESAGEPTDLLDDEVESPMCCQAAGSVSEVAVELAWKVALGQKTSPHHRDEACYTLQLFVVPAPITDSPAILSAVLD
jgi:hypothetical protein